MTAIRDRIGGRVRVVCWMAVLAVVFAVAATAGAHGARAATVIYPAGYHLVAGPDGTVFGGAIGDLYAFDIDRQNYDPVPADQPARAGVGYFAYFAAPVSLVKMGQDQHAPVTVVLPPNGYALVGNPSAFSAASVQGADAVYDYDSDAGYVIETSVAPGAGALVYSAAGGAVMVQPVATGVDGKIATANDALIALALAPAEFGGGYVQTKAELGGDADVLPAGYSTEYSRYPLSSPDDPDQTLIIGVRLEYALSPHVASAVIDGFTAGQLQAIAGDQAAVTEGDPPSGIGDAARLFHLTATIGDVVYADDLVAFRRGLLVAFVYAAAPQGLLDGEALLALAHEQDARLAAAPGGSS